MKRLILLVLTIIVVVNIFNLSNEEIIIPDTALRLRIIPNSNNTEDIYIKELVKKDIESNIYPLITEEDTISTAKDKIENNISSIESNINNIFESNSYTKDFTISLGKNYFPEKTYKGITYEEGYYDSLVVTIGSGEGDNWWCVLFPNFCLLDKNNKSEYKSYVKELISKYSK